MSDPLEDPRAMPLQVFTTAASLLELVDKKIVLTLRDGRTLFGVLRSFDSFGNLVIQETVERIYLDNKYAETVRGVWIVRGENVALLGEIDLVKEDESEQQLETLEQIDFDEAEKILTSLHKHFDDSYEAHKEKTLAAGIDTTPLSGNPYIF